MVGIIIKMKISIELKNQNKEISKQIFNKLYDDLKQYRKSEYDAFLILTKKNGCICV